jgi:intracellular sulfur oxidation DsrE/DsrF family protein
MPITDTIILITRKGMGQGPEDLQLMLLEKYLQLLDQSESLPAAICFYTEGVHLLADSSTLLPQLHSLEEKGVRLIVCSTCLKYYQLTDKLKAGIAGSMADIIEAQERARKVISL